MNAEKLAKLQAQVRTGGKGTARRKKKVVHKTAATDDKKLQVRTFKFNVSGLDLILLLYQFFNLTTSNHFIRILILVCS